MVLFLFSVFTNVVVAKLILSASYILGKTCILAAGCSLFLSAFSQGTVGASVYVLELVGKVPASLIPTAVGAGAGLEGALPIVLRHPLLEDAPHLAEGGVVVDMDVAEAAAFFEADALGCIGGSAALDVAGLAKQLVRCWFHSRFQLRFWLLIPNVCWILSPYLLPFENLLLNLGKMKGTWLLAVVIKEREPLIMQ
jgi:hypothetical protein